MSARSPRSRRPTPTSFESDNSSVDEIWNSIYDGINRTNEILLKVPPLTDLDDTEKNEILGEAHFLRALHYHNLVKLWGDVPIRLTPVTSPDEAADAVRSPVADVYAQIIADLTEAGTLITSTEPTTQANIGAVHALRARVALYQADYATALAEADAVIDQGYTLAPAYSDLFDPDGQDTPEDIFKVIFTPVQFNLEGFYYTSEDFDGRGEVAPTQELMDSYEPGDARLAWSITLTEDGALSGSKWPTTIGGEDMHAIRFAEVLLIKAEAQARLNDLAGAVETYNPIRVRAGLAPHVLGTDVTTPGRSAGGDRTRATGRAGHGGRPLARSGPDRYRRPRCWAFRSSRPSGRFRRPSVPPRRG